VSRTLVTGLSPGRLRALLLLLFGALAIPSAVLVWQTQSQLRWESLHQYRTLAEEMAVRVDAELQRQIALEEARSESEYRFLIVSGDPGTSRLLQRSPIAALPDGSQLPGLLGHFQVDAQGRFSTPLLPETVEDSASLGLGEAELDHRRRLRDTLLEVLNRNQLVTPSRALADLAKKDIATEVSAVEDSGKGLSDADIAQDTAVLAESEVVSVDLSDVGAKEKTDANYLGQAAFDRLNSVPAEQAGALRNQLGRVDELRLDETYANSARNNQAASPQMLEQQIRQQGVRAKRTVRSAELESVEALASAGAQALSPQVRIFESEIDPFEFALLDSGHAVLFRKVWRDGQRTIQGLVIDQTALIQGVIGKAFAGTALWQMSDLVVAHRGDVLTLLPGESAERAISSARDVRGELLYRTRMSAPLDRIELIWSINRLPAGPAARVVTWSGALLLLGLIGAFLALYRLGLRQILLARQQQNFVSAVSHELKTPLTSIRMYAELLKEGWADEPRKRDYYSFIHDESERLSRLIANVLQLARLERNDLALTLRAERVGVLVDMLRSRLQAQVERAGFSVDYRIDPDCADHEVLVDADAFSQIMINLVDNALKFSRAADEKRIVIHARADKAGVVFAVRDHGPGIPKAQMKRIFDLFYRCGDEMTRESTGTGIGLALVRQLARAMHGEIEVNNREPGAEFELHLPSAPGARQG
jgi:signal transduction histidine kinase